MIVTEITGKDASLCLTKGVVQSVIRDRYMACHMIFINWEIPEDNGFQTLFIFPLNKGTRSIPSRGTSGSRVPASLHKVGKMSEVTELTEDI